VFCLSFLLTTLATSHPYTLALHVALPIGPRAPPPRARAPPRSRDRAPHAAPPRLRRPRRSRRGPRFVRETHHHTPRGPGARRLEKPSRLLLGFRNDTRRLGGLRRACVREGLARELH